MLDSFIEESKGQRSKVACFPRKLSVDAEQGASSFFVPRAVRTSSVLTPEKIAECEELLGFGMSVAATARKAGVKESTFRKALGGGRVAGSHGSDRPSPSMQDAGTTKSERSRLDGGRSGGSGLKGGKKLLSGNAFMSGNRS